MPVTAWDVRRVALGGFQGQYNSFATARSLLGDFMDGHSAIVTGRLEHTEFSTISTTVGSGGRRRPTPEDRTARRACVKGRSRFGLQ